MNILNSINVSGTDYALAGKVPIGNCSTPAGSEAKECVFDDSFSLAEGYLIAVTFEYANTYGDGSTTYPKLQIDSSLYPIKIADNGSYAKSGDWGNSALKMFLFDGTYMNML